MNNAQTYYTISNIDGNCGLIDGILGRAVPGTREADALIYRSGRRVVASEPGDARKVGDVVEFDDEGMIVAS